MGEIKEVWHFLNKLKVTPKVDHLYLGIKTGQVGHITSIYEGQVSVKFKSREGVVVFCADELKRIK